MQVSRKLWWDLFDIFWWFSRGNNWHPLNAVFRHDTIIPFNGKKKIIIRRNARPFLWGKTSNSQEHSKELHVNSFSSFSVCILIRILKSILHYFWTNANKTSRIVSVFCCMFPYLVIELFGGLTAFTSSAKLNSEHA